MEQAILNNNINPDCTGRQLNIFLELLNERAGLLNLLYSGFDATTSNHVWEQSNINSNTWATIQTGGVSLNNANILPLAGSFRILRVRYTDICGYDHYTEAVAFYEAL